MACFDFSLSELTLLIVLLEEFLHNPIHDSNKLSRFLNDTNQDDNHTNKIKNSNKYQNYHISRFRWNKTTINLDLGGNLPS